MNINRIRNVCKRWYGQFRYFSPFIALGDFVCATILRKSTSKLKHNICERYYNRAKNIILKKYGHIVNKWKICKYDYYEKIDENCMIFLFWWQGEEFAPNIIRECIKNIKAHSGKHKIVIIDQNTWHNYTNIPDYILKKVTDGTINFTLFSDILRCSLLYDNGGIWIDPTCYMTKDFDSKIYNYFFYTIRHGDEWEFPICKGLWATFFLASGKGNPIMGFMRELFLEFWKEEKAFIVYLSIDLFLSIAYENIDYMRDMIESVPMNNVNRDDARNNLIKSKGKDMRLCLEGVDQETYIHKLTYKMYIEEFN